MRVLSKFEGSIPENKIHKESFVSAPVDEDYSSGVGTKKVKIIYDGDEYEVEVGEGESISLADTLKQKEVVIAFIVVISIIAAL